jgi:CHAT domain-containing protein
VAEAAKGKQDGLYAVALGTKAYVLMLMDHPELARPMAEEALTIEQRFGNDPDDLADVADTLIYVCQRSGDSACAQRTAELEVNALRTSKDVDPERLVRALLGLMYSRQQIHDYPGARATADEAMAIAARSETVSPDWAILENNAGGFYMFDGDLELAQQHLKRSLDIDAQLHNAESPSQAAAIGNLAYIELRLGHTAEALQDYPRARELFVKRFGPGHSQTALIDVGYGDALTYMGRYQEAIQLELDAHRVQREQIRLAIRLMPEQQALSMANIASQSFNTMVSVVTRRPEIDPAEVYQEVVRSRALVTEEMAQRQAVLNRKLDPAVEPLEKELDKERHAVMELQGTPAATEPPTVLTEATAKMEATERELAQRSAVFRADERAQSSDLADLRRHMPEGSVLVSYVSYGKYADERSSINKAPAPYYMAFVLHRNSERIGVYDLGDATSIVDLVERMRTSVDAEAHGGGMGSVRNEREYRAAGLELRKRIWDPMKRDMLDTKLVLVTPDGILNLVPFSALPTATGYLVEHGPVVHILTSERDLLPSSTDGKKRGLLAIGSPAFEMAKLDAPPATDTLRGSLIPCDAFAKMAFHQLPASLSEVREISSVFKRWNAQEPEQLLTGEEATRSRFLDAAPQSRILHIATHAFVLDKSCGNGNPLLHSGLVFAGANTSRDTAILTAQQIASIDLKGVDWAVLSACNTGNGELKDGEGVLGLERAFRVAGARSVVMSLWPVDDQVTREFMNGLYAARFGRHATTAVAVWSAARTLLKSRQAAGKSTQPWYWAGFVGAGAWQ